MEIIKVKRWLEHKSIASQSNENDAQFDIVFEDPEGIKEVCRFKDKMFFTLNLEYPALRGDFFVIEHFNQDKISVKYKIVVDGNAFAIGHCPINSIIVKNGFLTDEKMEDTIMELSKHGVNIIKPTIKK